MSDSGLGGIVIIVAIVSFVAGLYWGWKARNER